MLQERTVTHDMVSNRAFQNEQLDLISHGYDETTILSDNFYSKPTMSTEASNDTLVLRELQHDDHRKGKAKDTWTSVVASTISGLGSN